MRFLIGLTLALSLSGMTYAQTASVKTVTMKSISYDPKRLQIKAGESVEWENKAYTEHSATGATFDTGLIAPGKKTKTVKFSKPGVYQYHCSIHGKTMSGEIEVLP